MDYLTQDVARQPGVRQVAGWILDYHILDNVNPRDGEPTLHPAHAFADSPSVAEIERRDKIMAARLKEDAHAADAGSGQRPRCAS